MRLLVSLIPRRGESLMQRWIRRQKTKELVLVPAVVGMFGCLAFALFAFGLVVVVRWL